MRVKVGDKWYDAEETPICIELTIKERLDIATLPKEVTKYAGFPTNTKMSREEMIKWMD